jgi:rSAM/selenodomain-associated transferase 1
MAWDMPEGGVLGIFGKRPEPGRVKTRLAAAHGPEFAARAAEAMLFDTLDRWAGPDGLVAPGGRVVLVFDPPDAGPWFDERCPEALALQPQADGHLGARMRAFFEGEFEDGATRVVLIGADSPTLDPTFVLSAFLLLDHKDVVLVPAADGGYALIGCRPPLAPSIFEEGVPWSTAGVLEATVERVHAARRSLAVLPPWYDVDTPESWAMLRGHVLGMLAAGKDDVGLPRTLGLILEGPAGSVAPAP